MTISIYIAMGLLISDLKRLERMYSKALIRISELEDQIEDERMMFSEHRSQCGYVEPFSDEEPIFETEVEI